MDNQNNETPAWSIEKKPYTISANLRCDYCGDNFQIDRNSQKRLLGGIESEDEVLRNIKTIAQTKHSNCFLKAKKPTTRILNYSRKNLK